MGGRVSKIQAVARRRLSVVRLAISVGEDGSLPTEFRLFESGWNETTHGSFLFDEEAAEAVMAAYEAHGVDLAIDLEHQMLDDEPSPDPTAKDARGWFKLEVRDDGSLWAIDVTWTPDGAARLTEKRQRYVSPAFHADPETGRVLEIVNVAITSTPATHNTPALVAASKRKRARDLRKLSSGFSFADISIAISKALDERYPGQYPWVIDVFDTSVVFDVGGTLYEVVYVFDGGAATLGEEPVEVTQTYTPAESVAPTEASRKKARAIRLASTGVVMSENLISEALDALVADDAEKAKEILKAMIAEAAGANAGADPEPEPEPEPEELAGPDEDEDEEPVEAADDPEKDDEDDDEDKEAVVAATSRLTRITGKTTLGAAVEEVEVWRASHLALEKERVQLAKEKAALELNQRRENARKLISLGAETPHTSGLANKRLCKRLLDEPLEEQNARVAALLAARGGKLPAAPKAPVGGGTNGVPVGDGGQEFATPSGVIVLSARELKLCADKKIDPKDYAARRAARKKGQG